MRIGVDVDDVLAVSLPAYIAAMEQRFGVTIPPADMGWEAFRRFPQIRLPDLKAFFQELEAADFLGTRPLLPEARTAIETLRGRGHALYIVTGRTQWQAEATDRLLRRQGLDGAFQGIFHKEGRVTRDFKRAKAKELALDVFMEDELLTALAVAELDLTVVLFDKPWNQAPLPGNVLRATSWREALHLVGP